VPAKKPYAERICRAPEGRFLDYGNPRFPGIGGVCLPAGSSPESIAESFPVLSLEEVFGAIAYYLANQTEVDQYLQIQDADFASMADQSRESNPLLYKKLAEARQSPTPE
jgi:hypothetical protein